MTSGDTFMSWSSLLLTHSIEILRRLSWTELISLRSFNILATKSAARAFRVLPTPDMMIE